jgi:hypothetical protein
VFFQLYSTKLSLAQIISVLLPKMSKATAVKEAVRESLIGSEEPVQLSAQTKARFHANAVKDSEAGELSMGLDDFINCIAPENEDYVSVNGFRNKRD